MSKDSSPLSLHSCQQIYLEPASQVQLPITKFIDRLCINTVVPPTFDIPYISDKIIVHTSCLASVYSTLRLLEHLPR